MLEFEFDTKIFEGGLNNIESSYSEACDWLRSLGVFPASNRYEDYQRQFREFRQGYDESLRKENGLKVFSNALGEAADLIRIKKSLESVDSDDYISQLEKISSGKPFKNNISSDPGRDFSFELSMASRFLSAGYEINLTTLADAEINILGRKLFLECKRVQSPKKILARLSEASVQVARRVSANRSTLSRGLIAVKVTEILNPQADIVVLNNHRNFIDESKMALHSYIRENEGDFARKISGRVLGILYENGLNGIARCDDFGNPNPAFVSCRSAAVLNRISLGMEDQVFLNNITPKLTGNMRT